MLKIPKRPAERQLKLVKPAVDDAYLECPDCHERNCECIGELFLQISFALVEVGFQAVLVRGDR